MRIVKLIFFISIVVFSFLFSPVLGFLAQVYLYSFVGDMAQDPILSGIVQFGTQALVTIIISLPFYWLFWGRLKRKKKPIKPMPDKPQLGP